MCTNITIPRESKEEPLISARTLDWFATSVEDNTINWSVNFVPRGQSFPQADLPGEISWTNKYAFVGVGTEGIMIPIVYADGLNEKGLCAAHLSLFTSKYPKPKPGVPILYNANMVPYILGNFKNIYEVKEALLELNVVNMNELLPKDDFSTLLHYIVTDANGNSLIIEFVDGEMRMYTNRMGVLTNDPTYDWQLTNNQFYQQLSVDNITTTICGEEVSSIGQLGIPGDPSPRSRFVRAAFLRHTAFRPQNISEAIGAARQILQTLSVPIGTMVVTDPSLPAGSMDWTQWSVIRDHTNLSYYFYTDFNSNLYGIHLGQLDLNASKQTHIDIMRSKWYKDVTQELEADC
jgi:choloylglycine hydrolase